MTDPAQLAERYMDAVRTGDLAAAAAVAAPEITFAIGGHPLPPGLATFQMRAAGLNAAFSDVEVKVERVVANGSLVAVLYRAGGVYTGTFGLGGPPLPPSGKRFSTLVQRSSR
ncbi:MAG: ester cyclase [Dehalococcoidia bacterium]|nr:ester cyclase [Dehalococcoidia bacterium]MCB9486510.1 ester cyclase [Thermoflexaceae bacterium]